MSSTVSAGVIPVTLLNALGPKRPNRRGVLAAWRQLRRQQQRQAARYGDTAAERQSRAEFLRQGRVAQRALIAARKGRRIDLLALLSLRRDDDKPVWALADPTEPVGVWSERLNDRNGVYRDAYNDVYYGPRPAGWHVAGDRDSRLYSGLFRTTYVVPVDLGLGQLSPSGIPPLPAAARAIVASRKLRRRALWLGLLYQPESWLEERPDPAIVVEWRDRPGEYYALCVWGADRARIMEFVD